MTEEQREQALTVVDRTSAERLLQSMRGHGMLELLHGHDDDADDVPTLRQVAVVVRGLADYTHNQHMLGESVRVLGEGGAWPDRDDQAHVLGRYFHAVADQLRDMARAEEARIIASRYGSSS